RRGNGGLATAIGIANAGEHIAEGITKGHRSSSLPARLDQAGNQAVIAEFAQRYTAHLELAVECTRTAGNLATVADAGLGRIARKRGQLELCAEALFHRLGLIHNDRLQFRTLSGILIDELTAPIILFY